nr:hypothetical protein [Burkholderia gladioli]
MVDHLEYRRLARRRGVDIDRVELRHAALAAQMVLRLRRETVAALTQFVRHAERPGTALADLHAADRLGTPVVVNVDDRADLAAPLDGRTRIVGCLVAVDDADVRIDVVDHAIDQWPARRRGVDRHRELGGIARVAERVDLDDRERIGAADQRVVEGQGPVAIGVDGGTAEPLAAVPDFDRIAGRVPLPLEDRRDVLGIAAVRNRLELRAFVVVDAGEQRRGRAGLRLRMFGQPIVDGVVLAAGAVDQAAGEHRHRHREGRADGAERAETEGTRSRRGRHGVGEARQQARLTQLDRRAGVLGKRRQGRARIRVRRHRIFVVLPPFRLADQLGARAVVILDDDLGLIRARAFQADMQILADALHGDLARSQAGRFVDQHELAVRHRIQACRRTRHARLQFDRLGNGLAADCGELDDMITHGQFLD